MSGNDERTVEEEEDALLPLFESKAGRGRLAYRLLCLTVLAGIVLIWLYRLGHVPQPGHPGRAAWLCIFAAEVAFGLYWIITQAARWRVVYRRPFRDRLAASRYKDKLPAVDIFVCTADPTLEPPSLVINTVLSVMSYNYAPEKLAVYLSDDGCSELTFYALLEASKFSEHWIPFCKKYNAEPRAPEVYFGRSAADRRGSDFACEWTRIKNLYEDMKRRIDSAVVNGCVPRDRHKGFLEWDSGITKQDHQSIVQIVIDGWDARAADAEGERLPSLVYLSREKRPGWAHNFKAGSMNSLIRVSSEITNAPVILNLDCDMYSNDPDAICDAMCFFLDEKQGKRVSYVQYPQRYNNITKHDIYGNVAGPTFQVELAGIDGVGGALYIGTGCFHRRESLSGKAYSEVHSLEEHKNVILNDRTVEELEAASKPLANCSYEKDTLWGKEMGLVYGCPVEDIVTGLTIQCRGWKPVYYNPKKNSFVGIAPTTLDIALVQFKRWSEGMFQIFWSRYCPFTYGRGKIPLGAQMGYCIYLLWAPLSLPILCYVVVPTLYLLRDVALFPEAYSLWFLPFAYVYGVRTGCSLAEGLMCGDTLRGWWNLQRMTMFRRVAPFFFAFVDTVSKQLGLSETSFAITDKEGMDEELQKRCDKEIMEFGSSSIMFVVIGSVALVNLVGFAYGVTKVVFWRREALLGQIVISGMIVALNLPVYQALFFRRDKGRLPLPVLLKSMALLLLLFTFSR